MATTPLAAATPTFELDGTIDERIGGLAVALSVSDTIDGLSNAELVVHNAGTAGGGPDYLYFDRDAIDYGTALAIKAGSGDRHGPIFDGFVTAIRGEFPGDGTPRLGVLAEDRLQDLRMTRRTRTFEDQTDADVIARIASDHGLGSDVTVDGPSHRILAQLNQSDLAFIRQRARLLNAEIWMDGTTMRVASRPDRATDPIVLSYRQNLREFTATGDLAHQRTGVRVSGWDVSAKEAIVGEANPSILKQELDGRTSGPDALEQAFGERLEQLAHLAPASLDEATAYATAEYARIGRRFVTGHAIVDGDARIRVGATVELAGVGAMFDGPYAVAETRHLFDVGLGYRTMLSVERAGVGT